MLTVWCVYWGDKYPEYYVHRLKSEVEKHLTIPHQFKCLTDQMIAGIETVPQVSSKQGWWQKNDLFWFDGPSLYFDLDTVITGNLDVFVGTRATVRTLRNWAASGHGGCQSSIMYWEHARVIYDAFDPQDAHWPPINKPGYLWGDQEHITAMRDGGELDVDYFNPAHAKSYKYHCRNELPAHCRAVIFHGKPDPHEVSEPWFQW